MTFLKRRRRSKSSWRPTALRRRILSAACLMTCLTTAAVAAASLEYQVKAVFLLHFAQFVEWPDSAFADAKAPFQICVLGDDPFDHMLDDTVRGETLNGRSFDVHRYGSAGEAAGCHILFISDSEAAHMTKDIEAVQGLHVLTVGDGSDFVRSGGDIAFTLVDNKVRLLINPAATKAANLKLSSKLLQAAQLVNGSGG